MSEDRDVEPVRGLPARLPPGEILLWQGAPDLRAMALRAFHVRKVAIYFALLVVWRFAIVAGGGASLTNAMASTLTLVGLGIAACAILCLIALMVCRTTVYSITSRRVVMRIGVALPITFNIPFKVVESGALKLHDRGTGSIPLKLAGDNRLSFLVMWPHVRPWRVARAEPTLRFVPEGAKVAQILSQAVAAALPDTIQQTAIATAPTPASASDWPLAAARA